MRQIQSGQLSTGTLIPSETELQVIYNASRTPIRQALDKLAAEGLIARRPGRGTFVSNTPPGSPVAALSGFSRYYRHHYREITARTISVQMKVPPPDIAEFLEMQPDQPTTHLERLRLVEDKPVAYLKSILAPQFAPGPFEENQTFRSMAAFLLENFFVRCTQAKEEVDVILPLREDQKLLEIDANHPVLQVRRKVYDETGEPILSSRYIVNSAIWKYRTSLAV